MTIADLLFRVGWWAVAALQLHIGIGCQPVNWAWVCVRVQR